MLENNAIFVISIENKYVKVYNKLYYNIVILIADSILLVLL